MVSFSFDHFLCICIFFSEILMSNNSSFAILPYVSKEGRFIGILLVSLCFHRSKISLRHWYSKPLYIQLG